MHQFTVALQDERLNPAELAAALRDIAARHTAAFKEEAAQTRSRVARNSSIPLPDPAPLVVYQGGDFNNQRFMVRAFLPTRSAMQVTSAIHEDFVNLLAERRKELKDREKAWDVEKEVQIRAIIEGKDKAA
jgi:hypothetical protein